MQKQSPFLRNPPLLVIYGNHDYDYQRNPYQPCKNSDSGGEAGIPTSQRFNLNIDKPWFSTRQGPVLIIALSSEHPIGYPERMA